MSPTPWAPILARLRHPDVWGPGGLAPLEAFRRAGRGWLARCPSHRPDRNPSFWMREGAPWGRCFACGYRIGWIDYLAERSGRQGREAFWWAVNELARRAGLPPIGPATAAAAAGPDAFALAAQWLRERLLDRDEGAERCRRYLELRGIPPGALPRLPVGYLPSPELIAQVLRLAGCPPRAIAATGLTARYLARVPLIFIYGDGAAVAGFKGRAPDPERKHILNAKGFGGARERRTLYCADLAREAIGRHRAAILVEGEFDCLPFHAAAPRGVELVAVGGTAKPSPETFATLRALGAERVLLALDADAAGEAATVTAVADAWAAGVEPLVAAMPEGCKDPDEACRAHGPGPALDALRRSARAAADWLTAYWARQLTPWTPERAAAVAAEARRLAAAAPAVALERLAQGLAAPLGSSPHALLADLARAAEEARRTEAARTFRQWAERLRDVPPAQLADAVAEGRQVLDTVQRLIGGAP